MTDQRIRHTTKTTDKSTDEKNTEPITAVLQKWRSELRMKVKWLIKI